MPHKLKPLDCLGTNRREVLTSRLLVGTITHSIQLKSSTVRPTSSGQVLGQRLLLLLRLSHLVVSVVDDDPQPFPRRRDYAPSTRRRWTVTGPGPGLFSEGLFADSRRRRSPTSPWGSQPAATIVSPATCLRSTAAAQ